MTVCFTTFNVRCHDVQTLTKTEEYEPKISLYMKGNPFLFPPHPGPGQVTTFFGFGWSSSGSPSEQVFSERKTCSSVHCSSCKACSSRVNGPCFVLTSSFTLAQEDRAAAHRQRYSATRRRWKGETGGRQSHLFPGHPPNF